MCHSTSHSDMIQWKLSIWNWLWWTSTTTLLDESQQECFQIVTRYLPAKLITMSSLGDKKNWNCIELKECFGGHYCYKTNLADAQKCEWKIISLPAMTFSFWSRRFRMAAPRNSPEAASPAIVATNWRVAKGFWQWNQSPCVDYQILQPYRWKEPCRIVSLEHQACWCCSDQTTRIASIRPRHNALSGCDSKQDGRKMIYEFSSI